MLKIFSPSQSSISTKLKNIPKLPGVYFFKNEKSEIIYIGKAKALKNRVKSYFTPNNLDWKAQLINKEAYSIDYILTESESESEFLEAQLIKKHQPKYNTLLKNGDPFLYIFFTATKKNKKLPTIKLTRTRKEKGTYFGPFLRKGAAKAVYNYLKKTFKLNTCKLKIENGCLDYHMGLCAGTCLKNFDEKSYLLRLDLAKKLLKNQPQKALKLIKQNLEIYIKNREFEKAKILYNYLENLESIFEILKLKFNQEKYAPEIYRVTTTTPKLNNDALKNLQTLLNLKTIPKTIDCFDISHFQGHGLVGSCVRFTDGTLDKTGFRKFKIKTLQQQNDYAALQEIVSRRYKDKFELPDIVLIDGGKGQLNAIKNLIPKTTFISLAKREERLFSKNHPEGTILNVKTPMGKLLIQLRNYTHHFAISYHKKSRELEYKKSFQ